VLDPLEARADVVGSLLRPSELLEARERLARDELSPAAFKHVEDRAVDEGSASRRRAASTS
jgi:5-methyltetrahydropteroyltriglutamate--homocysteine methyltransferase